MVVQAKCFADILLHQKSIYCWRSIWWSILLTTTFLYPATPHSTRSYFVICKSYNHIELSKCNDLMICWGVLLRKLKGVGHFKVPFVWNTNTLSCCFRKFSHGFPLSLIAISITSFDAQTCLSILLYLGIRITLLKYFQRHGSFILHCNLSLKLILMLCIIWHMCKHVYLYVFLFFWLALLVLVRYC
jgi:hypothetical protein